MTKMQQQFEQWIKATLPSASLDREYVPNHGSYYFNTLVQMAWKGWEAALASHAPSGQQIGTENCSCLCHRRAGGLRYYVHPEHCPLCEDPSEAAAQPYGYKLPSVESGSITVSSQPGKGAGSRQACNLQSTSGVPAPEIEHNDH